MSIKNVQARLDLIHELTIGDGTTTGDKKIIRALRKLLNRAETQVVIDTDVFASQLNQSYQRRKGKAPSKNISEKYKELTKELIRDWKDEIKNNVSSIMASSENESTLKPFCALLILTEGKLPLMLALKICD